eukprot:TRINITY_DN3003_c0_g2_i7.p1 TRINITY_DN3003_c0_g2~~TRINITY_DN3003_c0_g2_i7.p1  ORF type:complete len:476 (-),score=150.50 TRINITY_DN3003_c0_g2_i7:244-1671(-)
MQRSSSQKLFTKRDQKAKSKAPTPEPNTPINEIVVIRANDLSRIKQYAQPISIEEERRRAELQDMKHQHEVESKKLRERISKIDQEKKAQEKPSESQQRSEMIDDVILKRAQYHATERVDEVKKMNSIMQLAKCAAIREAQIEEKRRAILEREEEERRLNEMAEIERLKSLRVYEEREQRKAENLARGAEVIRQQLEERRQEKARKEEETLNEMERMKLARKKMEEEERLEAKRKMEKAKVMQGEIVRANTEQVIRKFMKTEEERNEDVRIAQYLAEKAQREQQQQEEAERRRAEKEREVARLRALQERARDDVSQRDALRAKRAEEARDREWRERELQKATQKTYATQELFEGLRQQRREKEVKMTRMAQEDAELHRAMNEHTIRSLEEERRKAEQERQRRETFASSVRDQIKEKEFTQRRELQEYLTEGARERAKWEREHERIEELRKQKLREMEEMQVPEKYRVELERARFR